MFAGLMILDGSDLAEGVLPMVADMATKLALEVELFRAYHIPYNSYADDDVFMPEIMRNCSLEFAMKPSNISIGRQPI